MKQKICLLIGLLVFIILIMGGCIEEKTEKNPSIKEPKEETFTLISEDISEPPPPPTLDGRNVLLIMAPNELDRAISDEFIETFSERGANVILASTERDVSWEGSNGETVAPDLTISDVNVDTYDIIVILCRSEESWFLLEDMTLQILVQQANEKGKIIVATEFAPVILARAGILKGKTATVKYSSSHVDELEQHGATYLDQHIVSYDTIITARWIAGYCGDLVFAIVNTYRESHFYAWALERNDIQAYKKYLEIYPRGFRSEEMRLILEPILFDEVVINNTIEGYEEYLRIYPEDFRCQQVLELLEPLLFAWAKEQNTIQSYEKYLGMYPSGNYVAEAKSGIEFCKNHKARVIASYPKEVFKEESPWSHVEGPIWRWQVEFKEVNGIKVFIDHRNSDFISEKGYFFSLYPTVAIEIPPHGKAADDYWVSSPSCDLCGATAYVKYEGFDEYGNPIKVSIEIKLLDEWKEQSCLPANSLICVFHVFIEECLCVNSLAKPFYLFIFLSYKSFHFLVLIVVNSLNLPLFS